MEGTYPVRMGKEEIGLAQVVKKGLYYQIQCHCKLTGEVIHRLVLITDAGEENLGIPMPEGDGFSLTKRLPVSRVPGKLLHIHARPRSTVLSQDFFPLSPEEPFAYLYRLKNAYLVHRDGQPGLVFREKESP